MKHGNRLRVVRAERQISQLDLSLKAGIGSNRVWRIENGYAASTPEERTSLAKALDCTELDLFPASTEERATA